MIFKYSDILWTTEVVVTEDFIIETSMETLNSIKLSNMLKTELRT